MQRASKVASYVYAKGGIGIGKDNPGMFIVVSGYFIHRCFLKGLACRLIVAERKDPASCRVFRVQVQPKPLGERNVLLARTGNEVAFVGFQAPEARKPGFFCRAFSSTFHFPTLPNECRAALYAARPSSGQAHSRYRKEARRSQPLCRA
jgi:hypothetical protein